MANVLVKNLNAYEFTRAVKGPSFIKLYSENNVCTKSFFDIVNFDGFVVFQPSEKYVEGKTYYTRNGNSFEDALVTSQSQWSNSLYEVNNDIYETPYVVSDGIVAATDVSFDSFNKGIIISLPKNVFLQDKLEINFNSPADSCNVDSLWITDGTGSGEKEFELVDSKNVRISSYKSAFLEDSTVSVIIDLENSKAVVQNAAYSSKVKVSSELPTDEEIEIWINPDADTLGYEVEDTVQNESNKLITSGAVYKHTANKQDKIYSDGLLKGLGNGSIVPAYVDVDYTKAFYFEGSLDITDDNGWVENGDGSYTFSYVTDRYGDTIYETDRPFVSPIYSTDSATRLAEMEAWGKICDVESNTNLLKFTCFEGKPEVTINFQVAVIR